MDITQRNLTEIYHSWRWPYIYSKGCYITERRKIEIYHSWRWPYIYSKGCYITERRKIPLQYFFSVNKFYFGWKQEPAI